MAAFLPLPPGAATCGFAVNFEGPPVPCGAPATKVLVNYPPLYLCEKHAAEVEKMEQEMSQPTENAS